MKFLDFLELLNSLKINFERRLLTLIFTYIYDDMRGTVVAQSV
jgi:hypothetical protein